VLVKGMLIPLVLLVCFGGYFVARTKPFNPTAVGVIVCMAVSALVLGFAHGFVRVIGAIGLVLSIFALYAVRGKH
jgi:hypothetical protein